MARAGSSRSVSSRMEPSDARRNRPTILRELPRKQLERSYARADGPARQRHHGPDDVVARREPLDGDAQQHFTAPAVAPRHQRRAFAADGHRGLVLGNFHHHLGILEPLRPLGVQLHECGESRRVHAELDVRLQRPGFRLTHSGQHHVTERQLLVRWTGQAQLALHAAAMTGRVDDSESQRVGSRVEQHRTVVLHRASAGAHERLAVASACHDAPVRIEHAEAQRQIDGTRSGRADLGGEHDSSLGRRGVPERVCRQPDRQISRRERGAQQACHQVVLLRPGRPEPKLAAGADRHPSPTHLHGNPMAVAVAVGGRRLHAKRVVARQLELKAVQGGIETTGRAEQRASRPGGQVLQAFFLEALVRLKGRLRSAPLCVVVEQGLRQHHIHIHPRLRRHLGQQRHRL